MRGEKKVYEVICVKVCKEIIMHILQYIGVIVGTRTKKWEHNAFETATQNYITALKSKSYLFSCIPFSPY